MAAHTIRGGKWCGPCVQMTPHLTALQKRYPQATIVGITTDRDVQKAQRFVESKGDAMDYTVAVDTQGATDELTTKANLAGIPHAFVVAADNTILYSSHPAKPEFEQKLKEAVEKAQKPQVAIPPVSQSVDELKALPIKELKAMFEERGLQFPTGVEKGELASTLKEKAGNVTYYR
ncbi:thioredoxin-like protein [Dunaliella salina]|uniref:glutaredoxin-dependent peroxiredoxin n=1 Tax=Dunaliella salina TaxID=3046 RepID=A0ABQ7GYD3_DUNSA|nr:thioredoxin-like protein [Dunaliella salina]|eukprot:KAF5839611.1 thioredoxin-like protein [Dunaliella salina]